MYQFSRFEENNTRKDDRISILKSFDIGLPLSFYEQNKIFNFKYAVLFYDQSQKAIGILFSNNKNEKGRFTISRVTKGGARISAASFLKGNKIDVSSYSRKFQWKTYKDNEVGNLYVIELEKK